MKKLHLLLVVSFLFAFSTFAQVKISGGILGGVNLANASVDPPLTGVDLNNLTGYAFGGILNFEFIGGVGIQVEPMYIQNGVKLSAGTMEAKFKVNYIEVPAILTYTFASGAGPVEPYILAGPVFGIRLSANYIDENGNEQDLKDQTKSTNFGGTFGAGVKIHLGMNSIFVEGRYTIGFTDINNDPTDLTVIKSKGLGFFAGLTFPF